MVRLQALLWVIAQRAKPQFPTHQITDIARYDRGGVARHSEFYQMVVGLVRQI